MHDHSLQSQRVGVFDSGVGGLSVLLDLLAHLPDERFDFVADERYLPYGDKPQHEITSRVLALSAWLYRRPCKAMVMACNTATAAAATQARDTYPTWPIVGMEPAVKPASLMTRSGVVGILATANTVASERFKTLVQRYEPLARVIAQPCPGLVELIETCPLPQERIELLLAPLIDGLLAQKADVIVLGCTHYPFVAGTVQRLAGKGVSVIETGLPVARQLKSRLQAEGLALTSPLLPPLENMASRVNFFTTGDPGAFKRKLVSLLGAMWGEADVQPLDL